MAWKYNPFTGTLDQTGTTSISNIVRAILVESDETATPFTTASIIFDENSILYNDDNEVS